LDDRALHVIANALARDYRVVSKMVLKRFRNTLETKETNAGGGAPGQYPPPVIMFKID
jgi:hypothetical protein